MEERAFRTASKRCTVNESRNRMLEDLIARKIGLKEIEDSIQKEESKFKGWGNKFSKTRDIPSPLRKNHCYPMEN